ncbi:unnamed protein product [Trichobilharzia regenti]|nr:unnamed protein product [Trichobilharzia regenti]
MQYVRFQYIHTNDLRYAELHFSTTNADKKKQFDPYPIDSLSVLQHMLIISLKSYRLPFENKNSVKCHDVSLRLSIFKTLPTSTSVHAR